MPRLLRDEPDCPLLTARPTHFNFILNYFRPNKEEGTAQGTPDADALIRLLPETLYFTCISKLFTSFVIESYSQHCNILHRILHYLYNSRTQKIKQIIKEIRKTRTSNHERVNRVILSQKISHNGTLMANGS